MEVQPRQYFFDPRTTLGSDRKGTVQRVHRKVLTGRTVGDIRGRVNEVRTTNRVKKKKIMSVPE